MPKAGTTKKASKAAAKAPCKSSQKGTTATSADAPAELPASKCLQVKWDADRTNRLLDWLDQNPHDHNCLFSDSMAAAKEEGHAKVTAKGAKNHYYVAMAKASLTFMTSLMNYGNHLHTQYCEFNQKLSHTGAGMEYSDVDDFPYWECLHGYWHTLPNFNPLTVTSDPGQDLEDNALDLFQDNQPWAASSALMDLMFEDDPPAHPLFLANDTLTPEEQAEIMLTWMLMSMLRMMMMEMQ
ncbi:hypothetical protein CPB84DRAFT_1855981 [Gymnopilus junonius]|uniref:Uncharacterized protein n=1 Tax=Gymnopilus junonius TaxID=109634 RepID=A0A9P5TEJ6_GYMJU|nr:hypothetical protein CPB84DRAFT_1855981 [Gymnopilus junonius]